MSKKNRTAGVRRYLAIASQEVASAMRLAAVCAVACGTAILITQIYVNNHDDSMVGGAPFFLFISYIALGIGIGLAAFSYLSERETDRFYKLLPASPFFTAVLKTVVTLVLCSAFIAVTVYTVYEVSGFTPPFMTRGYGYVTRDSASVKGGAYGLLELKGTLLAFYYGFSVGAFCATVFSRTVVAVIHTAPFLVFKYVLGIPATEWITDRGNFFWGIYKGLYPECLYPECLFSPELGLVGAWLYSGDGYRLVWFETPLLINGAGVLALTLLLTALRRGEHSGRVLADRTFYPVYALPFSLCAATVLEYLLGTFNGQMKGMEWAVRYLTVSAVLFLIIGFLFERNIKKWWRVLVVGGTVFLILFGCCAVITVFDDEVIKLVIKLLK